MLPAISLHVFYNISAHWTIQEKSNSVRNASSKFTVVANSIDLGLTARFKAAPAQSESNLRVKATAASPSGNKVKAATAQQHAQRYLYSMFDNTFDDEILLKFLSAS